MKYVLLFALAVATAAPVDEVKLSTAKPEGKLEVVATFCGPMPTGVTVSQKGRVFVNYPRWGDAVELTTAEVKDGKATAFPPDINEYDQARRWYRCRAW